MGDIILLVYDICSVVYNYCGISKCNYLCKRVVGMVVEEVYVD